MITGDVSGLRTALGLAESLAKAAGLNVASALTGAAGGFAGIATLVAGFGGAAFSAALKFDEAFDHIRSSTGKLGASLAGLETSFAKVFENVPATATQVANAISEIAQRTGLMGAPLEKLAEQLLNLSHMTGQAIEPLVHSTTRLFGDWSIATDRQSDALNTLFKTSQQTGVGINNLTQLLVQFGAPLRALGFSVEQAAALMGKWEREGVNLQTVLAGLKFALGNFVKAGDEPAEAFKKVVESIKNAKNETEGLAITFENFGKRAATDMFRAIIEGRFNIDELVKSIRESKETIESATADTRSFGEEWTILSNRVTTGLAAIGKPLASGVNAVLGFIITLGDLGTQLDEVFGKTAKSMGITTEQLDALIVAAQGGVGSFALLAKETANSASQFDALNEKFRQGKLDGQSFSQILKTIPEAMKLGADAALDFGIKVKILGESAGTGAPKIAAVAETTRAAGAAAKQAAVDTQALADAYSSAQVRGIEAYHAALKMAEATRELSISIRDVPPDFAVTLAEIAKQAKEAGISLDVMIPPDLKPKIEAATNSAGDMGTVVVRTGTRSKEALREIRQAINTISDGIANAIIHWEGFGKAGIAVLEAVGKAILKNVIQQILDASGVVDTLVAGIGKVLSKLGFDAAGKAVSGAGAAAQKAAASAAPGAKGAAGAGGGIGSLSSVLGIAGLGVSVASGIVQGIQGAHMEADIAKIEISTRQVKEQLVGGIQPTLDNWLPKLDYLLNIWKALLDISKSLDAIQLTMQADLLTLQRILSDNPNGLGGGFWGTAGGPGARTAEELKQQGPFGQGASTVTGETDPIGTWVANISKLSRGFADLNSKLPTGGYQLKPGEAFAPMLHYVGRTLAGVYETAARELGLTAGEVNASVSKTIAQGIKDGWIEAGTTIEQYLYRGGKTPTPTVFEGDPRYTAVWAEMQKAWERYFFGKIDSAKLEEITTGLQGAYQITAASTETLIGRFSRLTDVTTAEAKAIMAEVTARGILLSTRGITPGYSGGGNVATNYEGQGFTASYLAMLQGGGHQAVDLGNSSFINLGKASSAAVPKYDAAQIQALVDEASAQLQAIVIQRAQQDAAMNLAQLNAAQQGDIYRQYMDAKGDQSRVGQEWRQWASGIPKTLDELQAMQDELRNQYYNLGSISTSQFNAQFKALTGAYRAFQKAKFFATTPIEAYGQPPINYAGMLSAYQLNLQQQTIGGSVAGSLSDYFGAGNLNWGGADSTGQVTVYNMDLGSTKLTNSITEGLWANGFKLK